MKDQARKIFIKPAKQSPLWCLLPPTPRLLVGFLLLCAVSEAAGFHPSHNWIKITFNMAYWWISIWSVHWGLLFKDLFLIRVCVCVCPCTYMCIQLHVSMCIHVGKNIAYLLTFFVLFLWGRVSHQTWSLIFQQMEWPASSQHPTICLCPYLVFMSKLGIEIHSGPRVLSSLTDLPWLFLCLKCELP